MHNTLYNLYKNVLKQNQGFFNCYLAILQQIVSYSRVDSLTNLKVTGSFVMRLGP